MGKPNGKKSPADKAPKRNKPIPLSDELRKELGDAEMDVLIDDRKERKREKRLKEIREAKLAEKKERIGKRRQKRLELEVSADKSQVILLLCSCMSIP